MIKQEAIYKLYSNAAVIRGDDAFDVAGNPIAYDEVAVQALMTSEAYKDKRAAAYPSIPDQLDLLYHGGYDVWKSAITAIKEEYPK